jgi:hypothetical protein
MTTPADTQRVNPFAPAFESADTPRLGISDYDALADLFLGDDSDTTPDNSPEPAAPIHTFTPAAAPARDTSEAPEPAQQIIEAVIVGHLPVRAQFWAMQYARSAADDTGHTVAVLRCIGDDLSIDLLHPSATRRAFSTIDAKSLDDALAIAGRNATHWLLVVDELSEPQLIQSAEINRITLLTSAARPAIIAAYQVLKHISTSEQPDTDRTTRVVVMGSEPEPARHAASQLTHAAGTFLATEIEVTVGCEKIDSNRAVPLFRGHQPPATSALDLIHRAHSAATRTTPGERTVTARREPAPEASPALQSKQTPPITETTTLAHYIEGLTPLTHRCPIEPLVQLALDADSRIHLLACATITDPLRSLTQACAWASLNRDLILAAAQRDPVDTPAEPIMHLLVDDVPTNRRLLDAPIRLHLLRSVPVQNAQPVWFSAPLN